MSTDDTPRLSFEFFPPRTDEGKRKLFQVQETLGQSSPDFFSVTYGAGGTTRETTQHLVETFLQKGISAAPHLSFGGDSEETIKRLVGAYQAAGVKRIVALRGDMPSGMGSRTQMIHANELVAFIREHFGDHFHIEVAAYPETHPEAKNYDTDIEFLKGKFDAGANSAITQYFFNPDAYFYFVDQCLAKGIDQSIYPGIMPITNYTKLSRFSDMCGAEIPRWVRRRLESYGDDQASIAAFGQDFIIDLCDMLLEQGAPGLHFYTMNQAEPCSTIVKALGLIPAE